MLRALRTVGAGALALVGVGALFLGFLSQTGPGQTFFLRAVLGQADRILQEGGLEVRAIRSAGLWRGLTLEGVALRDGEGRPFLEADSIRVAYSLRMWLGGDWVLSPLEIWSPQVVIETLEEGGRSNLQRIFLPEEEVSEPGASEPDRAGGPPPRLELRNVRIRNGGLVVRTLLDPDAGGADLRSEGLPNRDERYRVIRVQEIEASLPSVELLLGERERVEFASLSLRGEIFPEPFWIEDLQGVLTRTGERLELRAEPLALGGSRARGRVILDWAEEETSLGMEVSLAPLRLEDFHWLDPRLPVLQGEARLQVEGPLSQGRWKFREIDLAAEGTRIQGEGGFELGEDFRFIDLALDLPSLDPTLFDPWMEAPWAWGGQLQGRLRLEGPMAALQSEGEVTFADLGSGIPASTLRWSGGLGVSDDGLRVRRMSLRAEPLRWGTFTAFFPDLRLQGDGALRVLANGDLVRGLDLNAEVRHTAEGVDSGVSVAGSVQSVGGKLRLALEGQLEPLSMEGMSALFAKALPVAGTVRGGFQMEGPLDALEVEAQLESSTGGGGLTFRGDPANLAAGYVVSLATSGWDLSEFFPALPQPFRLSGQVEWAGQGLDLATLAGEGAMTWTSGQVGGVPLDRLELRARAEGGRLVLDTLDVRSSMGWVGAGGELGLRPGVEEGVLGGESEGAGGLDVAWEIPDLAALRPLLFGGAVPVQPGLTELERQILIFEGADPETLDPTEAPPLAGRVAGSMRVQGGLPDLSFSGQSSIGQALWREARVESARLHFRGRTSSDGLADLGGELDVGPFGWGRLAYGSARADLAYTSPTARLALAVERGDGEGYHLEGSLRRTESGLEAEVERLEWVQPALTWALVGATRIQRTGMRFEISPTELRRSIPADGSVRVLLGGVLDMEGESQFRIDALGVEVDRVARLLQQDPGVLGTVDLELTVEGPAASPVLSLNTAVQGLVTPQISLSRIAGTVEYRNRVARASLDVEVEGRRVLGLIGSTPADFALSSVEKRFPETGLEAELTVEAFPAATLLAFLPVLEEVEGVFEGRMSFRGGVQDLQPSGALRLRNGALALPELGFHPRGMSADLQLQPDGVIRVDVLARARGSATISGVVDLSDLTDPTFNLQVAAEGFQAVERRDLEARVGGQVNLTGRYTRPRVTGAVRVEQGVMFLEEFARSAEVVDLADPSFFDVVDTTLVAVRPVVEAAQNPFLQNLRVDVDLTIQRDFWLRSREINVEIGGGLIVAFDRARREILLVGNLAATRGNYLAFGRQFQVREGGVEFVGTPGVNPILDIQAVHRLRRQGGEPLDIVASVGGTLLAPQVTLSSEAQPPIAQSDLISYLIFGRPSYALGSGETSVLQGAAGAGVSAVTGTLATQLSQVLARQIGIDFFNITQAQESDAAGIPTNLGSAFADTQVEVGQYLRENLFLALVLRPLRGIGGTQVQLPGARLEWRFSDTWILEGFLEDRFGRQGVYTFGDAGLQISRIFGMEIYREWGY